MFRWDEDINLIQILRKNKSTIYMEDEKVVHRFI